ncbi:MAG: hypothetical protein ILP23_08310, partial [Paludibacteraceae bacterium]|nr:hypothetical protein [Paludibacteraceae bacterium]
MTTRTLLLSILFSIVIGSAQGENISRAELENRIDDIIDAYYTANDPDGENASEEVFAMLRENLEERLSNPIVINGNKQLKEDLESLQFLSMLQVEAICSYVATYGAIDDLNELFLIDGLYRQDVLNLMPFVTTSEAEGGIAKETAKKQPLKNALKHGKHEIALRGDTCPEATESNQYYAAAYYKFHYSDRIYAGLNAEKDAGE